MLCVNDTVVKIFCLEFLPKAVMFLFPRPKGSDWSGDTTPSRVQDGKGRSNKFALKGI